MMLFTLQVTAQTVIDKAISAEDHNRKRPLFEALDAGFKGIAITVEVNKTGELMCGKKSFSETYLAPLKAKIDQNNGKSRRKIQCTSSNRTEFAKRW